MKAKVLLKKLMRNYVDIECSGIVTISEDSPVSVYFFVADECDIEGGEYFYTYLDDEVEMKDAETFLGQSFDYAFPLRESDVWVGIIKVED